MRNLYVCVLSLLFVGCGLIPSDDYKSAVSKNDYESAHQIVENLHADFLKVWEEKYPDMDHNNDNRAEIEAAAEKYTKAAEYVYCAEARMLIAEGGDNSSKIVYLFNEVSKVGEKVPSGTGYYPGGVRDRQENVLKINCYRSYVTCINSLCNTIVDLAIDAGNKKLAMVALTHYLPDVVIVDGGVMNTYLTYKEASKIEALQKLEMAAENGLFE